MLSCLNCCNARFRIARQPGVGMSVGPLGASSAALKPARWSLPLARRRASPVGVELVSSTVSPIRLVSARSATAPDCY